MAPRMVDPGYLKWLKRQPCVCGCGKGPPCDAAHLRVGSLEYGKPYPGMRRKPDDKWALPLRRECHMKQTNEFGELQFWTMRGIDDPFALCLHYYWRYGGKGGTPEHKPKTRRKIASRPFPKQQRPFRGKSNAGSSTRR